MNIILFNFYTIFKILLCLYILLLPYYPNHIIIKTVNHYASQVFILLLIIYFISKDYTISLLISICLIITIVFHSKDKILNIKKKYKEDIIKEENILKKTIKDNYNQSSNNNNNLDSNINNSIAVIDTFITNSLDKIQSNIFNEKNNNIYFSGNYDKPLITAQGSLDLNK